MSDLAIITGAASGLGETVLATLSERGMACLAISRNADWSRDCPHICADFRESHNWVQKLAPILSQLSFERLWFFDIAAILPQGQMLDQTLETAMEDAMQVNLSSPLAIGKALAQIASAKGATLEVVHVSSGAALRAIPNWGAYCISKAAAMMAWRALDEENTHITSHIFQPGVIDTLMQRRLRESGDPMAAPVKNLQTPQEVADRMLQECGLAKADSS